MSTAASSYRCVQPVAEAHARAAGTSGAPFIKREFTKWLPLGHPSRSHAAVFSELTFFILDNNEDNLT